MTFTPTPSGASEWATPPTGDYVIRRYSRSSPPVMATRLRSGPWEVDRLRRWLSSRRYRVQGGTELFVILDQEGHRTTVIRPRDWLLRLPNGALQAMDDEEFRSRYGHT